MDKEQFKRFLTNMKQMFIFITCWTLAISLVWLIPYVLIYHVLIFIGITMHNAYVVSCSMALLISIMVYFAYLVTKPS